MEPETETGSSIGLWLLLVAALSAAAGAVHFALTPQHAAEWQTEGLLFAVVGWMQVACAMWVTAKPADRAPWVWTLLVNLAALEAYLWSRTLGLPFGPLKGVIEEIGWLDGLTAVGEFLVVVICTIKLVRFRSSRPPSRAGLLVGGVVACLLAGSSAAALSSSLGQHGHSGGHGDAAVADPGFGAVDSPSARQSMFERGERQKQLVVANGVATKYPTVAEAEKAGLRRALTYVPGTGAIYYDPKVISGDFSTFDASKPGAWLFSGNEPDSTVVGMMYVVDTADPPAGFIGAVDVWHRHSNVCVVTSKDGVIDVPLPVDSTTRSARCREEGGVLLENTPWLLTVWNVPGWQNPRGEFAQEHPDLICLDGRVVLTDPLEGCRGR